MTPQCPERAEKQLRPLPPFKKIKRTCVCFAVSLLTASIVILRVSQMPEFILEDVKNYDSSGIALDREGNVINVSLSAADEWCMPISLDNMGRWLPIAVTAIEDKRFYEHRGMDAMAILRALYSNVKEGRVISGASTITSQLIRISDPRPRTVRTKLSEFWKAACLERVMNKRDILELYLNRAPFGGNIRGVEAAARSYFNKSASSLSLGESVMLISLLRSPSRLRPDRYPERALDARNRTLENKRLRELIPQENIDMAKIEPVAAGRHPMPNEASMAVTHATNQSYQFEIKGAAQPHQTIDRESVLHNRQQITTTLDMKFQYLLERTIRDALREYPQNISASGIIVDNRSGEVRAYVGNARHGESLPGAQVDCGDAPRSPGSALKPFLYAEAFQRGLLTPASLLADTPLLFRGAPPRNFDLSYRGPVSARTALSSSLNAPAVRVLRMIGYSSALARLREFGFSHLTRESSHYTDSLILGGCEVTLAELAAAYRAMAGGGMFIPLRWTKNTPSFAPLRAASEEAAYLTTDILQNAGGMMPLYKEIFEERDMRIAFKTGTSHGFRDAWCAGYSKEHTVVTWLGSPSGAGDSRLTGLRSAAPITLKIIRDIWSEADRKIEKPGGVYSRTVCAVSGSLPTKNCRQRTLDLAIKDVSPISRCEIHKNIDGVTVTVWPQSLRAWMRTVEAPSVSKHKIKIVRPSPGDTVILKNENAKEKIFLSAEGDPPHYWYIDGKFTGADITGRGITVDVGEGNHRASVMSNGEADSARFHVQKPQDIYAPAKEAGKNIIN
ncbi:MAG: penicillin-binding protein 1C [Synergistaceae bacterium]|jgi:penicillin-binding protein 1C|nr:penicillin-binding protein 1C [Synergistaceae bacterium]